MIKFGIAGVFATLADFAVYGFCLNIFTFKYDYLAAGCLSFCVGVTVSYYISIKWVFTTRNIKNKKLEMLLFFLIGVVGQALMYLFNEIHPFKDMTIMLSHTVIHIINIPIALDDLPKWSSKIIVTIIVFFWNFFARKFIIFNDKKG